MENNLTQKQKDDLLIFLIILTCIASCFADNLMK